MSAIHAEASGRFRVGDFDVHRLGFGAMRITGPGIWGEPADRAEALKTLRRLPQLGVDFIDTADSYGPGVSEELIREALHPYSGMLIATKGGFTRQGPDRWTPDGRPKHLREAVHSSLRRLRVERIDLWQLHRIDPKVPRAEQLDAVAEMQRDGLIRHVGLSEVGIDDIEAAQKRFAVVTVQNRYNLVDRGSEAVLEHCAANGIGFIPWYPLAAGALARSGSALDAVATKTGASTSQVALAWVLKRSPVMLPIPGTGKVRHLEENVGAAAVELSDAEFAAIDRQASGLPPADR